MQSRLGTCRWVVPAVAVAVYCAVDGGNTIVIGVAGLAPMMLASLLAACTSQQACDIWCPLLLPS
jgi:hypothetical protein